MEQSASTPPAHDESRFTDDRVKWLKMLLIDGGGSPLLKYTGETNRVNIEAEIAYYENGGKPPRLGGTPLWFVDGKMTTTEPPRSLPAWTVMALSRDPLLDRPKIIRFTKTDYVSERIKVLKQLLIDGGDGDMMQDKVKRNRVNIEAEIAYYENGGQPPTRDTQFWFVDGKMTTTEPPYTTSSLVWNVGVPDYRDD
ncbi:hypothetical protein CONLIGDRAFT_686403 [Coniochaeta ligniaria NRRL 30616]|uniref:Uncharacterized protein n=1 Tax=Coniochaeta ligniaria NRRL 30616 TaxID=1408157 RepID=A0A1J7I760_9PEZI|nr:hypothetical protein CONLIGDRAFT_686403 [Coniochaeta ligniaria NRRL 30616]